MQYAAPNCIFICRSIMHGDTLRLCGRTRDWHGPGSRPLAVVVMALVVSINRDVISNVITGHGPRKSGHLQSEHRWTCRGS